MQSHFVSAPLNPYTTYYWRVVGKTMALQEKWSPVWSFTTGEQLGSPPPSAVTLVSPVSGSTSATPTFTWNAVSNSTFYFLWINDSTGTRHEAWYERSTAGCASGTGRCAVTPVVPLTPGPIQWGVLTWNAAGLGAWSAAGSFTLKALAKPTLDRAERIAASLAGHSIPVEPRPGRHLSLAVGGGCRRRRARADVVRPGVYRLLVLDDLQCHPVAANGFRARQPGGSWPGTSPRDTAR